MSIGHVKKSWSNEGLDAAIFMPGAGFPALLTQLFVACSA